MRNVKNSPVVSRLFWLISSILYYQWMRLCGLHQSEHIWCCSYLMPPWMNTSEFFSATKNNANSLDCLLMNPFENLRSQPLNVGFNILMPLPLGYFSLISCSEFGVSARTCLPSWRFVTYQKLSSHAVVLQRNELMLKQLSCDCSMWAARPGPPIGVGYSVKRSVGF